MLNLFAITMASHMKCEAEDRPVFFYLLLIRVDNYSLIKTSGTRQCVSDAVSDSKE